MKKPIQPEFMWHLDEVVLTFQIAIVTTVDAEGRVNAAPFGLVFPFSTDQNNPQMMLCSNNMWHTSQNIEATGEFVLNYAPHSLVEKVARTGLMYPEGVNEIEQAGLTPFQSSTVKPPSIMECYQHIECRLNRIIRPSEYQNNFIGDVLLISMNEDLLEKDRNERLKAADPLFLFGVDVTNLQGNYAGIGKITVYTPPPLDEE